MHLRATALLLAIPYFLVAQSSPVRPKAGKVELFKESDLRPGMTGFAWTVLAGMEPEPIPVEIIGILQNQWGPKQDIILGKMTGKATRTNVAPTSATTVVALGCSLALIVQSKPCGA